MVASIAVLLEFGDSEGAVVLWRQEEEMRGIGRSGVCLAAVLVAGAMSAATASAAEYEMEGLPEAGRCVPSTPKTGEYKGAKCITLAAGKGNYNWLPGPGPKNKFEGTASLTKLETVGKYAVACSSGKYLGEYKTPKTVSLSIGLVGCLDQETEKKCQTSPTKEAEIETTVEGELGFIKGGEKPRVGLSLNSRPRLSSRAAPVPRPKFHQKSRRSRLKARRSAWIRPPNTMRSTFKLLYTAPGANRRPKNSKKA